MSAELPGRAVVTGAASGIGRVYARRLAERGFEMLLVDVNGPGLADLVGELRALGTEAESLVADLARPADLETVAERLATDPDITLVINNAGTSRVAPFVETDWRALESMISVNVTALARLSLAALQGFRARQSGTLVNVGSAAGFFSYAGSVMYCGTKAFALGFTRGLQQELEGSPIRVQLVTPAATVSGIWSVAGVDISSLDAALVMTTEDCVDASLRGLELGEAITSPSLEDSTLLAAFETAGANLLAATTSTGKPASRYTAREAPAPTPS